MRQIGLLPGSMNPKVFEDYLLAQGMTSRAMESKDGWTIWVHNEDHLARAREAFNAFLENAEDPRFADAARTAEVARREEDRLNREYRKNVRDVSGSWDNINFRRRPLTMTLVVVCVAVYVAGACSPSLESWLFEHLAFFSSGDMIGPPDMARGLKAIQGGQVWRLITPIFLHGGILHLLFNMWALLIEGTIVETRRGTRILAVLVLVSAVLSNLGQYIYVLNFYKFLIPWVGISGVGYALFGYLWMKGRFEPMQGMILHPSSVRVMLLWLLLGFTGLFPMANGAHVAGLVVGMLFGLARF